MEELNEIKIDETTIKPKLEVIKPIKMTGGGMAEEIFLLIKSERGMAIDERLKIAERKSSEEISMGIILNIKDNAGKIIIIEANIITTPQNLIKELQKTIKEKIMEKNLEKNTEYEITSLSSKISLGEDEGTSTKTIIN